MPTFFAVLAGGVLIPLCAWRLVGARRLRDPFLIPVLTLAIGFTLAGLGEIVTVGGWYHWKLIFGLGGFAWFSSRWKASGTQLPPVP